MDVWSDSVRTRASAERSGADLPRTVRLDAARSFMDVPLAYGRSATRQETEGTSSREWVRVYAPLMAQPARRPEMVDESLELDPVAVQRAYRLHRARRRAHRNRQRETKRAQLRFWFVLLVLVAASIYLSIVIWHQIERTFGL